MSELKNLVLIDKGLLSMVINVLKRNGKNEVADELKLNCIEFEQNKIKAEAVLEWANGSGYSDGCETQYRVFESAIDYANKLERGEV